MKFDKKLLKYRMPAYCELRNEKKFVSELESSTNKKVICLDSAENTDVYKLFAVQASVLNAETIEKLCHENICNLINQSSINEIKLFSIECTGFIIDKDSYNLMALYVLRAKLD